MTDEREALREIRDLARGRNTAAIVEAHDLLDLIFTKSDAVLAVLPSRETDSRWEDMDHPHCVRCGVRIWAGQIKRDLPSGLREHANCDDPYHNAPRETVPPTRLQHQCYASESSVAPFEPCWCSIGADHDHDDLNHEPEPSGESREAVEEKARAEVIDFFAAEDDRSNRVAIREARKHFGIETHHD